MGRPPSCHVDAARSVGELWPRWETDGEETALVEDEGGLIADKGEVVLEVIISVHN